MTKNAGGGNFDYHHLRAVITTGLMPALSGERKRERKFECRLGPKLEGEKENGDLEEGEKEIELRKRTTIRLERGRKKQTMSR